MKLIPYITVLSGTILLVCSVIFDFMGIIGCLSTLLVVILIIAVLS